VSQPPFTVLHVCMGNICRSPMAERMLAHMVRARLGERAPEFVHTESAGTGGWHVGQSMNPPAARELARRGVTHDAFRARRLLGAHIDAADLVLTATADQFDYVTALRPDARDRTFVLGEFGRLLRGLAAGGGPEAAGDDPVTSWAVHERGLALVAAANEARGEAEPAPGDDLDDPWGRADVYFGQVADEIATTIDPLVEALLPK
jgi:protein-tyrosine phosphatase